MARRFGGIRGRRGGRGCIVRGRNEKTVHIHLPRDLLLSINDPVHPHRIGGLVQQFLGSAGGTHVPVVIHIFKIPAQNHDPGPQGIEFPDQRHIIAVARNQDNNIELFENGQFQRLQ